MGWFQKLIYGVDLDAEQQRGEQLDRDLKVINDRDYGPGGDIYNKIERERGTAAADQTYEDVQGHLGTSQVGDVNQQVSDAFWGELNQRTSDLVKPGGVVPTWVWIAAGVGLFFWMGGLDWLKGRLAK